MGLSLQQSIDTARSVLNDPNAVTYTEVDLLQYANDALDAILPIAPQYFYECGDLTCTADSSAQTVTFGDAHSLVSVDRVQNGNAVLPASKAELDRYDTSWMTTTSGPAVNWLPRADSPVRFYLYPPAPAGQILEVTYVRIPSEYTATADTELPETLAAAIADYIVAMAMSRDDEHINANRAQAFLASFAARVKG